MCFPTLRYSRTDLYRLRRSSAYPQVSVIQKLKELQLFRNRSAKKNKRVLQNIPVITIARRKAKPQQTKKLKHFEVPRLWYDLPSLLLSNVTSLSNKLDEVITTIKSTNADVVAITEAWQIVPELCNITDYQLFHRLRTGKRGGGLVLYCRSHLHPTLLPVEPPDGVETLWVRLSPPAHPRHAASVLICLVYHPPRAASATSLVNHIIDNMDQLRTRYPSAKVVVCGDFNKLNTSDIEQQLHLTQVVEFATHGTNTLDLILTDLTHHYLPPQPLPPMGRSTHLSVLWTPAPTFSSTAPPITKTYRPVTDSATRSFGQWITHHRWTEVLTVEDVHDKWSNYTDTITAAYQHFFPTKTRRVHPSDTPWITPRIKRLIEQRNQAFHNNPSHYKYLRNKVIREIKTTKATYYPTRIHSLKQSNISKWYTKIKDLCGLKNNTSPIPGVSHLPATEAAESINTHFATICQSLPSLDLTSLPAFLPTPSPLPSVHEFEVARSLSRLKSKRSTTPVDLPIKIYQEFAPEIATPLASIINASLRQSQCPNDWKTAYVTPVPKTLSPQSLGDLRPISITPIPSLLCEDFVFKWTYAHLAPLMDPQQYGNMRSSSTTHCLISLLDFTYRTLEQRKTSAALAFVDFRKAFDLVHHTTVISKAINLGLHPSLVSWLTNFLSQRSQVVRYQGVASSPQHLTCGVPQGTKLGPLCFLMLINDALTHTPHRWKYVDDTTLGVTVNNDNPDYSHLQDLLHSLQTWTLHNKVTVNDTKTTVMHINTSSVPVAPPAVTINDTPLQVVQSAKILGVTIDNKLSWKDHVNQLVRSATYKLYLLRRLKTLGTPERELASVYATFILPKLTYASPAWSSSLNVTQRRQLEQVQKRACRIILGPSYTTYQDALTALALTTLQERHAALLQRCAVSLFSHPRHRSLLPPAVSRPQQSVRHANLLAPIRARTDRYKNSAVPTMVKIINSM